MNMKRESCTDTKKELEVEGYEYKEREENIKEERNINR